MSSHERQGPRKPATKFAHLRKKLDKRKARSGAGKKPSGNIRKRGKAGSP